MFSAVAATIGALFQPVPAFADPAAAPPDTLNIAVPDVGSRPMALGTLALPGQRAATPTPTSSLAGAASSPALQQIDKGRNQIATMGDQLIQVEQDRNLAKDQRDAAQLKYEQAASILQQAQTTAADAAAQAVIDAAAQPPAQLGGGLSGLDDLSRLQHGDDTARAITRQIELAQVTAQLALDEETLSSGRYQQFATKYTKLNSQLTQKQAAQQRLELVHADELAAAEASQAGVDSALGAGYLAGAEAGRGADTRAMGALQYALAQRGDPYVWSEEGPDQYDCSGLMYAAYRSVGFGLTRVSRDQYWQTRHKVVSRYSLLPGDLLFFSHSNSWRGIHHVAMYAGNGMMVEAPRTGLNVRLVPVRWSRLFQATRVFGSIEGVTPDPVLGPPDAEPTTPDNPSPTTPPATTKPPTTPTTSPTTSKPPTSSPTPSNPSTTPTTPSTPPSSNPTTTPPATTPTTTPPTTTPPTTTAPPTTTTPPATTTAPVGGGSSSGGGETSPSGGGTSSSGGSSSGGSSSGGSSSATTPSGATSSANATESSLGSASASASGR